MLLISYSLAENILDLSKADLDYFDASVATLDAVPNSVMWKTIDVISEKQPLIFFHQRKAGGDGLRLSISKAAKKARLSAYFPCYNNVDCELFDEIPDNTHPYALYGAHFTWGEQSKLELFGENRRNNISCVTNFRDPLTRIISCLYYRFRQIIFFTGQELRFYPVPDLINLLRHTDIYGSSCVNEPFRILSGFRDELVFDEMVKTAEQDATAHTMQTRIVFDATVRNLAKCTPCVLELPQSYELLNIKYPSIGAKKGFSPAHKNKNKSKYYKGGKNQSLTDAQINLLRQFTAAEQVLYDAVRKKVESRIVEVFGKVEY